MHEKYAKKALKTPKKHVFYPFFGLKTRIFMG